MTTVIAAEGLTKRFGNTQALAGVDISADAGRVLALLGPNGAGKTTIVRILSTLLKPDGGHASVCGYDVVSDAVQVRQLLALTGQYASVDEELTGTENLIMICRLLGLSRAESRARSRRMLERFELADAASRAVKTYSGGMRRRLDLAASLLGGPEVLFLDEPTTGLDPRGRSQMWDTVRGVVAGGATVLLTTQYLDEADQLAERVVVVDHGRSIAEGTPAELKRSVGGARLELTLSAGAHLDVVAAALAPYVEGHPLASEGGRRVTAPVSNRGGLATLVVRALDAAGVSVDDVEVRQPSLDDVFFVLTGRTAQSDEGGDGPEGADDDEAAAHLGPENKAVPNLQEVHA
jgi:oleandomycin transport system ATP-binding protein